MRHVLLILVFFILISCSGNKEDKETSISETVTDTVYNNSSSDYSNQFYELKWFVDFDTTKNDFILKENIARLDTLTPPKLIDEINKAWSDIKLVFRTISHDTMFVEIPESEYLTQRIGTTGALNYISSTTYNLTELKGIKYINYKFVEGDHLSPGTMSRDDFAKYR